MTELEQAHGVLDNAEIPREGTDGNPYTLAERLNLLRVQYIREPIAPSNAEFALAVRDDDQWVVVNLITNRTEAGPCVTLDDLFHQFKLKHLGIMPMPVVQLQEPAI